MINFSINERKVSVDVPVETPLLWVIRDVLGLKGTKFGCGIAMCGACTVHLNGTAVRSCITSIGDVADSSVKTIEGLSVNGEHPLQKAWIEAQAPQCGYCQSGQLMQAASLLADNPDPSDAQINDAMNGNLCRCMSYVRIRKAIKLAILNTRKSKS